MNYAQKADKIVNSRDKDYGNPVESWREIAKLASIMIGKKLTALDCVRVLKAAKLRREAEKHKDDNLIDEIGYILIEEKLIKGDL